VHELGRLLDERRLVGQRVGGLFERRRPANGGGFQRGCDAGERLEEDVEVGEVVRLGLGDRRGLARDALERDEQVVQAGAGFGEVGAPAPRW